MTAEQAVRDILLTTPAVSLLVNTRVYPVDEQPQKGLFPRITYQRISTVARPELDGADEELPRVRLQLNCLAETGTQLRALAWAVRGLFTNGVAGPDLCLVRVDGHSNLPREPDTRILGARIDLLVTLAATEAAA